MNIKKNNFLSPHLFIGTSGWSYEHWKKNFYPQGLKSTQWLNFYATTFSTVEINTTFYHTPPTTTVQKWHALVPDDFNFAIKANRYITHMKRLNDCSDSLKVFYNSLKNFKSKVGPILFQLPPSFKINKERLNDFIMLLSKKYCYTFEFRHPSWYVEDIYEILSKNNIALCITDLNGKVSPQEITANFTYIRLHGPHSAYRGYYSLPKLKQWKKKIDSWLLTTTVYCYFDNDEKGYAIQDARKLKNLFE